MTTFVLPFEKMHGLGNDFIMLEKRHLPRDIDLKKLAVHICNRNFAIGADGIIVVDLSPGRDADFSWDYLNSDGSEAEMCGNGIRCFAKYVFERGFTDEQEFTVLTKAGIIKPKIESDSTVTVDMGLPKLPTVVKETLSAQSKEFTYTYIEVGNPHCVIFREEQITDSEFNLLGPSIATHKQFPKGVNVEFVNVSNSSLINCRVWERGSGPTLACGTGACASLVAANINNLCDEAAAVMLPGGELKVRWDKKNNHVYLNGPSAFVYTGQFNLNLK